LVGRIDLLSRGDRKDHSHAKGPDERRRESSGTHGFPERQSSRRWCVSVAAQISRLATTWLHPLASLDDQIHQIEDCEAEILVIDADAFLPGRTRAEERTLGLG
jgi:hypothetical protein